MTHSRTLTRNQASFTMLLAAAIWGFAFVAQKSAMDVMGPFTFNAVRFAFGASCLLLAYPLLKAKQREKTTFDRGTLFYGAIMGVVLFSGAITQQIGLVTTTAGKAAFITGLYIVLVPAIMSVLGHLFSLRIWAAVGITVGGLYLLSVPSGLDSIVTGDLWVLASAFLFALHILVIGRASRRHDPIQLSILQFYVCALLSAVGMWLWEVVTWKNIANGWVELVYAGALSTAVAYTLQVVGQRKVASHVAAIILSLEAVFGAIGGIWLLGESMTSQMMLGCSLMFAGWMLAQIRRS